ncbi:MAG: CDGSH iron-sulfur domain-containing protein [Actinomycetota bacterium]
MATDEQRITSTENGPYKVDGVEVVNAAGETVHTQGSAYLCRCGGSSKKPFCDGTHNKNGFVGTEVADRGPIADRRDAYDGDGITIYDDRSVCAHIGRCTDGLPAVWKLGTEPWIDPEGASADEIAAVVHQCPSGVLAYARPGSAEPVEEELEVKMVASKDGPYFVRGGVQVASPDGSSYERRNRQALCRCGGSKNKPFWGGTHWSIDFKDPA